MMGKQIYLNERNEIIKETDYYVIIEPHYSSYFNVLTPRSDPGLALQDTERLLAYKKASKFYLSSLPKSNWDNAIYDGCCISVWLKSGKDIESGEKRDLTLATSHHGLKTVKIVSPTNISDLPRNIKNELLKKKI